jgi:hypothetical protein
VILMVSINYKQLVRDWKLDSGQAAEELAEAMAPEGKKPDFGLQDFSLRRLAEECMGYEFVSQVFDPRPGALSRTQLREAMDAVDSTGFSNITGQLIINSVMQAFQNEAFVASRLVSTIPTKLDGEKIPGIGKIKDPTEDNADNLTVPEGMPYPHAGVSEDYVETPSTTKRGLIVPVTREAIFFDRTGVLVQRCSQVGERLGLNKEKRLIDAVAGLVNLYKWKGTTYQTYYSETDSGSWTNHLDGNDLVDWTDVDNAELLFADMLDPNTNEPVLVGGSGMTLLVTPHRRMTGSRVLGAAETRTGTGNVVIASNPLSGMNIRLEVSRLLYRRMIAGGIAAANAKATWFYGDLAKAFAYMENWPITVTQSADNSEAAFNQDIIMRFKASERGAVAVMEPRAIVRCRALSTSSSSGS